MRIGAGLLLIAVGAVLRFGISTAATHGIAIHTIGDILMIVGVLGVVLWLVVSAPWSRRRQPAYRDDVPAYREEPVYREERAVYREDARTDEVPPARYSDRYQDEYRH
jgi:FtsZ-interacting cell division protein ZipA